MSTKKNNRFLLPLLMIITTVVLFFAWVFFYIVPQRPTVPFWVSLGAFSLMAIIFVIFDRKNIVNLLKMRFVHKAFFGIISLLITLAILVTIFIISVNYPLQFDVTKNKSYTISRQTLDVLSEIKEPMSIIVLRNKSADPTSPDWRADILLNQYRRLNKNITLEYINPIEKPSAKTQYQMTQLGEIIFNYGNGKQVRVYKSDLTKGNDNTGNSLFVGEEAFTQAIYLLLEERKNVVYFTVGHGERQIRDRGGEGLSSVRTFLENENYNVREINLILENIPTDASLIILASPSERFAQFELDKLSRYVEAGGKLLILYDSVLDRKNFNSNLDSWLLDWGFLVTEDYVIDPVSSVIIPVNIVPQYLEHNITKTLKEENVLASLVIARSIRLVKSSHGDDFEYFTFLI